MLHQARAKKNSHPLTSSSVFQIKTCVLMKTYQNQSKNHDEIPQFFPPVVHLSISMISCDRLKTENRAQNDRHYKRSQFQLLQSKHDSFLIYQLKWKLIFFSSPRVVIILNTKRFFIISTTLNQHSAHITIIYWWTMSVCISFNMSSFAFLRIFNDFSSKHKSWWSFLTLRTTHTVWYVWLRYYYV